MPAANGRFDKTMAELPGFDPRALEVEEDKADEKVSPRGPRVAVVTPYTGGNLGDAAIQDSMILNLRQRMPGVEFLGITLDCDNFLIQHGSVAFPLLADSFAAGATKSIASEPDQPRSLSIAEGVRAQGTHFVRSALRRIPGLVSLVKRARAWRAKILREVEHASKGYRLLRQQDLLIISGGGQLDEEYGGAWRLPFAMCKWVFLARLARVPCAVASVGAGRITSPATRRFIATTLRMCRYRSFRDPRSRAMIAGLFPSAMRDEVVPDLAFSLPDSELPPPSGAIRAMARGRTVIAIGPIAYAKPGMWPTPNRTLYERYVEQLARVLCCLADQGYFLVIVCSSSVDDESIIPDVLNNLDDETRDSLSRGLYIPRTRTWRELVAVLRDVDYLIASRLHSVILGFVSQTPLIAISFDPKVDSVMKDLQQTDYLVHFDDFTADDVLSAFDRLKARNDVAVKDIASYRREIISSAASAKQYDLLAGLAVNHFQSHN
jgi:polysaccharide pyruvyl transferase WcaK-like protein